MQHTNVSRDHQVVDAPQEQSSATLDCSFRQCQGDSSQPSEAERLDDEHFVVGVAVLLASVRDGQALAGGVHLSDGQGALVVCAADEKRLPGGAHATLDGPAGERPAGGWNPRELGAVRNECLRPYTFTMNALFFPLLVG